MISIGELGKQISLRTGKREEIHKAVDAYYELTHGIVDFSKLVEKHLSSAPFRFCLVKQIPTVNIEHLVLELLAELVSREMKIKVRALPLGLSRDRYRKDNPFKQSLMVIPELKKDRQERVFVEYRKVVDDEKCGGRILDSIKTTDGQNLPEFHASLRKKAFGEKDQTVDLSSFLQSCLTESLITGRGCPEFIYQRTRKETERGINIKGKRDLPLNLEVDDIRPPASWFTIFFLSLFIDGSRALLLPLTISPRVDEYFDAAVKKIKAITDGISPLIIYVPSWVQVNGGFTSYLLEHPLAVLRDPDWKKKIVASSEGLDSSLFTVFQDLTEKVINY